MMVEEIRENDVAIENELLEGGSLGVRNLALAETIVNVLEGVLTVKPRRERFIAVIELRAVAGIDHDGRVGLANTVPNLLRKRPGICVAQRRRRQIPGN